MEILFSKNVFSSFHCALSDWFLNIKSCSKSDEVRANKFATKTQLSSLEVLGFIFPVSVLFDEGVSTDTLLTLCLLTQAGTAAACGNTIIRFSFCSQLNYNSLTGRHCPPSPGKLPHRIWLCNVDHRTTGPTDQHHCLRGLTFRTEHWALRTEHWALSIEDWALRTEQCEDWAVRTEQWGLSSEDWGLSTCLFA